MRIDSPPLCEVLLGGRHRIRLSLYTSNPFRKIELDVEEVTAMGAAPFPVYQNWVPILVERCYSQG